MSKTQIDYKTIAVDLSTTLNFVMQQLADMPEYTVQEEILVGMGEHTFSFSQDPPPSAIFVSVEPEGIPVCSGSVDLVSATVTADGYTVYAKIESNAAILQWILLA